jgi:radical SAM superfamily enzyme YgiQ (UPF0313 family)
MLSARRTEHRDGTLSQTVSGGVLDLRIVLISTYELGRQPFGLASPAAWLEHAGASVRCLDLAVQALDQQAVQAADLLGIYLPMHTATRLAVPLLTRLRALNPRAHVCCYGLYAPPNADLLQALGADTILGGEFEPGLVALARRVADGSPTRHGGIAADADAEQAAGRRGAPKTEPLIQLERLRFEVPQRRSLPPLEAYAHLFDDRGRHTVGYTEATRGCKHTCRHCPIPPVYGGHLRVVQADVVLRDIEQQVAAGAEHITFGDPDFLNAPLHAMRIVDSLHRRWPHVTYDATIKIEHLLRHTDLLRGLKDTGCLFITSAVESVDDRILSLLDKRHTRADVLTAVAACRQVGLSINPTFVTFTPWTSVRGYVDLLHTLVELDLVEQVAPIQLAIRLLIPSGSHLLQLSDIRALVAEFDPGSLCYPWQHPDPRVDALHAAVLACVKSDPSRGADRPGLFGRVWRIAHDALGVERELRLAPSARGMPRLSEAWFC